MQINHFTINRATRDPRPLLFALLFLLAIFFSCDKSDDNPAHKIPRIKTITHGTSPNSDKEFYEYDSMGRVISITITGHTPGHTQYVYLENKIVRMSDSFIQLDTLYLNNKGLVMREMFGSTTYEYDANGYCNHSIFYNSDGKIGMEYQSQVSDGNQTVLEIWETFNKQLVHSTTREYEFLPNSVNTIGEENKGITFYGKQDKNLLSVETERNTGSESSDQRHYSYQIDAKNRVVNRWTDGYPEYGDVFTYYE